MAVSLALISGACQGDSEVHQAGHNATADVGVLMKMLLRQDDHWAVQHEAMQSFVAYARSPSSEDFREVIPRELQPGTQLNPTARWRCTHTM